MDVIVSDFDNTLFKRYHGVLWPQVEYLKERGYPVYIVTYRAEDQHEFISYTLGHTGLMVAGYGFAGSRKKDPATKFAIVDEILTRHNIVEALDDEETVCVGYRQRGIKCNLS